MEPSDSFKDTATATPLDKNVVTSSKGDLIDIINNLEAENSRLHAKLSNQVI